jgi:hypothetical protein
MDMICEDGTVWFTTRFGSAVFRYEIATNVCRVEFAFPNENAFEPLRGGTIQKIANFLIVGPLLAEYVFVYDLNQKKCEQYKFELDDKRFKSNVTYGKFASGNVAMIFGNANDTIALWDAEYRKIKFFHASSCLENKDWCMGSIFAEYEDNVYIPLTNKGGVSVFDAKRQELSSKQILPGEKLMGCVADHDYLWLIPASNSRIKKYNIKSNKVETEIEYPKGFEGGEGLWFINSFLVKDKLFVFPFYSNMFFYVDIHKDVAECIEIIDDDGIYNRAGVFNDHCLWRKNCKKGKIELIDTDSFEIEPFKIPKPCLERDYIKRAIEEKCVIPEDIISLREWMDNIV